MIFSVTEFEPLSIHWSFFFFTKFVIQIGLKASFPNDTGSAIALRHGCSPVNLLHIFRAPFPKNTSGQLLLSFITLVLCQLILILQHVILLGSKLVPSASFRYKRKAKGCARFHLIVILKQNLNFSFNNQSLMMNVVTFKTLEKLK